MTELVDFAHVYNTQQSSFGVQLWQGEKTTWLKGILAGRLKNDLQAYLSRPMVQVAFVAQKRDILASDFHQ